MEDLNLLDAVERYLDGSMPANERIMFDDLRKTNPEVDQLVVEHNLFMQQMSVYGERKDMKHKLQAMHADLLEKGAIVKEEKKPEAKVIQLWNKYRKVTAVAASIGGIVALVISGLVSYFGGVDKGTVIELGKTNIKLQNEVIRQGKIIEEIRPSKSPSTPLITNATGFLIDAKGYIVTNEHVIRNTKSIVVTNNRGEEFLAISVFVDKAKDIAILMIKDSDYIAFNNLPYGFKKSRVELGEHIFTLGFPRNEIVYGEGYLSAKTGADGDTSNCQISISANPGNSGGPILNNKGEVIGILSSKEKDADGVVYAVQSKEIFKALNEVKKDSVHSKVKMNINSNIGKLSREEQVKKVEDCVFMIKGY
jgi:serine protease Do